MNKFSEFNIKPSKQQFVGKYVEIDEILNNEVTVHSFAIKPSTKKANSDYLTLQIEVKEKLKVVFTGSKNLMDLIQQVPKDKFPFKTTITKQDKRLEFT